jgi:hypothetical protein
LRTREGIRIQVAAALAALTLLALPNAAQAQGGAVLDGTPLNVFADGLGAIQVRQDGVEAGLFYDPSENPAHAGLEIREGESYYPLEDGFTTAPGRVSAEPITVTDAGGGTRVLHTAYTVGPNLRVSEDITYTDGSLEIGLRYGITNISGGPVSVRIGQLADLFVGNNDNGNGVIRPAAPRFVGGRDEATQLVYGLSEVTPWAAYQEGDFEQVFDNFSGPGLNNTVDSAAPDNGVGAEWRRDIGPGATEVIEVKWLLAAQAPPGTVQPPPSPLGDGPGEQEIAQLPPPVPGRTVNISVRQGIVTVRIPPSRRFVRLTDARQIPVGATIDTRRGRVNLVSAADRSGTTQLAWFYSGIFRIGQTGGSRPITNLTLADVRPSCPRGSRASASQKRKKSRRLWGEGRGRFRTTGQFSSATVRGTRWLVTDRCGLTETKVTEGTVTVRDFVRRRNVVVRAGKTYVARRRAR